MSGRVSSSGRSQFARIELGSARTYSIKDRDHKVHLDDLATPSGLPAEVLDSFPSLQAARDLEALVGDIRAMWARRAPALAGLGGGVVKCGLGPLLARLLADDKLAGIAMNGGAAIHDLHNPDFANFAELCGARGYRVTRADQLPGAHGAALDHRGPALVEVVADPLLEKPTKPHGQATPGSGRGGPARLVVGERPRQRLDHVRRDVVFA